MRPCGADRKGGATNSKNALVGEAALRMRPYRYTEGSPPIMKMENIYGL